MLLAYHEAQECILRVGNNQELCTPPCLSALIWRGIAVRDCQRFRVGWPERVVGRVDRPCVSEHVRL